MLLRQPRQELAQADGRGVRRERELVGVGREMRRDGVLDDLEQLLGPVHAPDEELVQQLHHQPREPLEGARDAHGRVHFDEHALGGVDVDLEEPRFVEWGVEQCEETLWIEGTLVLVITKSCFEIGMGRSKGTV